MAIVNTTVADMVGANDKLIQNRVNLKLNSENPLVLSGAFSTNPIYNQLLASGPRKFSMPFLNGLPTDAMNVSGDDLNEPGLTAKMTAGEFDAVKHYVNMGFSAADIASMITGIDIPGEIAQGLIDYWTEQYVQIGVSTLIGARAAAPELDETATDVYSAATFAAALITAGSKKHERLVRQRRTALVTPEQLAVLQLTEGNSYVPASKTDLPYDMFQGTALFVTRAAASMSGETADVIPVLSANSVAFAQSDAGVAFEIERIANGGHGAGGDILHSRRQVLCMPNGFEWAGASKSGTTKATLNAALQTGSNWNEVQTVDRIGISFLVFPKPEVVEEEEGGE